MSEDKYVIHYASLPNVERATAKTMASYLQGERAVWAPFLELLSTEAERVQFLSYQSPVTAGALAEVFDKLEAALENPQAFAAACGRTHRRTTVVTPPSDTTEGRIVLGLYGSGREEDALAAYVRFVWSELGKSGQARFGLDQTKVLFQRGDMLLAAGYAAAALPTQKMEAAGLRRMRERAQETLTALDGAVGAAEQINEGHEKRLSLQRQQLAEQTTKLKRILIRAERRRGHRILNWREGIESVVEERFRVADQRVESLDRLAEQKAHAREAEFQALKDLFHVQLRLRAPVALWEQRSDSHQKRARQALRNFWIAGAVAVIAGICVPLFAGDYIAGTFTTLTCAPGTTRNCMVTFSAKGPLTVAGCLLATSVILWITKMQYRIFLSERHLSLDADEKRAFAETFMALKEGASVEPANETIVLASLFRPTQDGIIKDEDGGFDLSAAAVLAKQLAK